MSIDTSEVLQGRGAYVDSRLKQIKHVSGNNYELTFCSLGGEVAVDLTHEGNVVQYLFQQLGRERFNPEEVLDESFCIMRFDRGVVERHMIKQC